MCIYITIISINRHLMDTAIPQLVDVGLEVHKIQKDGEERYVLDAIIGEGMKSTQPGALGSSAWPFSLVF